MVIFIMHRLIVILSFLYLSFIFCEYGYVYDENIEISVNARNYCYFVLHHSRVSHAYFVGIIDGLD